MSTHLDRKALKRPDAFLEKTGNFFHLLEEHSRAVMAAVGVLGALAVGLLFYHNMTEKASEAAESALYEARHTLTEGLSKAKGDDWAQTAKPGLDAVEKITKDYGGTHAAFEAELVLGDVYFEHHDAAKAVEHYKEAAQAARRRTNKPLAQYSLAYAYEDAKQYDQAVDAFRQVVASDDKTFRGDAMMGLARNYALRGDKPKALDEYNQVLKEYPNSPMAKKATIEIGQLR